MVEDPKRPGKYKKKKKQIPAYIPEHDAMVLASVRKSAYRLDMCLFSLFGIRFGWEAAISEVFTPGEPALEKDSGLRLSDVDDCSWGVSELWEDFVWADSLRDGSVASMSRTCVCSGTGFIGLLWRDVLCCWGSGVCGRDAVSWKGFLNGSNCARRRPVSS